MKKRLIAFASVIMALIISVASLAGCNLVTKDSDRDMAQTVATVKISDSVNEDVIKKSDMIMAYLNYGYTYVQYYGYTQAQTFETIINNLVNTRILVQNAMTDGKLAKIPDTTGIDFAKYPAAEFLTEEQRVNALYDTNKYLFDMLVSYNEDKEDAKKADSFIGTARTAPTDAANAEDEVTLDQKKAFINDQAKQLTLADGLEYTRKAYNDVVKLLKNNSLLGADFKSDDLKTSEYYLQTLKSNYESQLLTAYEDKVVAEAKSAFTYASVQAKYKEIYDKQTEWSATEFAAALSSTTATEPIVVSKFGGYGYVYNLLLGVNDYQTTAINKIKTDDADITDAEYAQKRAEILDNGTVIKDLRDSWILSGYDFDGTKFTGDYTLVKDSKNSLPFKGSVKLLNEADKDKEDFVAEYGVTGVESYSVASFVKMMNEYMTGKDEANFNLEDIVYDGDSVASVYGGKIYAYKDNVVEYDGKIQELLFAFSTDSGSLNNKTGYNIKPAVDGSNSEEYVTTFAEAGRKLLASGKAQSYVIVASDYGYHIMFYSQILDNLNYDTIEKYLDTLGIDKGTAADWSAYWTAMMADYENESYKDNYLYLLTDSLLSSTVSEAWTDVQNKKINEHRYQNEGRVNLYKDVYADLLEDAQ